MPLMAITEHHAGKNPEDIQRCHNTQGIHHFTAPEQHPRTQRHTSMCLVWIVKYHICGCTCEKESIYCSSYQFCWGPRAIIFHSNLQTCEDCWQKGDKRVNERFANILSRLADEERQRNRRRDEQTRSKRRTSADVRTTETDEHSSEGRSGRPDSEGTQAGCEDADFDEEQDIQNILDGVVREESQDEGAGTGRCNGENKSQSPKSFSRPSTPVRDLDHELDPDYTPPWLLSIEQNCDLTRVCDRVRASSISRDYRARRQRTDWYALEGKSSCGPVDPLVCWFRC